MLLQNIRVAGLRNIQQASLELSPGFNYIFGENGSGKTSLLEAVYCLSFGRSFRSRSLAAVLSHGENITHLKATLAEPHPSSLPKVNIAFSRDISGKRKLFCCDEKVSSFVTMAKVLPVQYIGVDSSQLFYAGSACRRKFLDWGVFHVEHDAFYLEWKAYAAALKQRNHLLKRGAARQSLVAWDVQMNAAAEKINRFRSIYFAQLKQQVMQMWREFGFAGEIDVTYQKGWLSGDLLTSLSDSLAKDQQLGYTTCGPHRADLSFCYQGSKIQEVMSQGQQKLLGYMLRLSQGVLMQQQSGKSPIYLIDDICSEFDDERVRRVLKIIKNIAAQSILTGINPQRLNTLSIASNPRVFHVEHGVFAEAVKT